MLTGSEAMASTTSVCASAWLNNRCQVPSGNAKPRSRVAYAPSRVDESKAIRWKLESLQQTHAAVAQAAVEKVAGLEAELRAAKQQLASAMALAGVAGPEAPSATEAEALCQAAALWDTLTERDATIRGLELQIATLQAKSASLASDLESTQTEAFIARRVARMMARVMAKATAEEQASALDDEMRRANELRAEVAGLSRALAEREADIEFLDIEAAVARQETERQVSALQTELRRAQAACQAATETSARLDADLSEGRRQQLVEAAGLRDQLAERDAAIVRMESQVAGLQAQRARLSSDLESAEAKASVARVVARIVAQAQAVEQQVTPLQTERASRAAEVAPTQDASVARLVARVVARMEATELIRADLHACKSAARARSSRLEAALLTTRRHLAGAVALAAAGLCAAQAAEEAHEARQAVAAAESRAEALQAQVDEQEGAIVNMRSRMSYMQAELESTSRGLAGREADVESSEAEAAVARQEAEQQVSAARTEMRQAQVASAAAAEASAALETALLATRRQLAAATALAQAGLHAAQAAEVAEATAVVEESRAEALQAQLEEHEETFANLCSQLPFMRAEIAGLSKALAEREADIEFLEAEAAVARQETEQQVSALQSELRRAQAACQAATETSARLEATLGATRRQLADASVIAAQAAQQAVTAAAAARSRVDALQARVQQQGAAIDRTRCQLSSADMELARVSDLLTEREADVEAAQAEAELIREDTNDKLSALRYELLRWRDARDAAVKALRWARQQTAEDAECLVFVSPPLTFQDIAKAPPTPPRMSTSEVLMSSSV